MAALHDPAIDRPSDPEASVVDFARFRAARQAAGEPAERPVAPPDATDRVITFPVELARPPQPRTRPSRSPGAAGFDAQQACEQLVQRFRVMHEAMIELIVTCQELETAAAREAEETSELMVNLAMLSMSTERFHDELTAAVDGAFA